MQNIKWKKILFVSDVSFKMNELGFSLKKVKQLLKLQHDSEDSKSDIKEWSQLKSERLGAESMIFHEFSLPWNS